MISVHEAQKQILNLQTKTPTICIELNRAQGYVLAQDIFSQLDIPHFNSSAMDGIAVRSSDLQNASSAQPVVLKIIDEISAGKIPDKIILPGTCARIMTGAPVPKSADAVIMQENVSFDKNVVLIINPVKQGSHIRKQGEEIQAGSHLLNKGHVLNPASIGCLASAGIANCMVYAKPRVTILTTGSELKQLGEPLGFGQIYDSNSLCLKAAIQKIGIAPKIIGPIADEPEKLKEAINEALRDSDHVIICGGVSVGKYDFNKTIIAKLGVKDIFWQVAQKLGKPLYFGMYNDTSVFGVPGNPASALVCYYEYILPALLCSMGFEKNASLPKNNFALISETYHKQAGRQHFVKAQTYIEQGVLRTTPLKQQDSHMMLSFANANSLIIAPENIEALKANTLVEIHWL